jgi:hypothetical protein
VLVKFALDFGELNTFFASGAGTLAEPDLAVFVWSSYDELTLVFEVKAVDLGVNLALPVDVVETQALK